MPRRLPNMVITGTPGVGKSTTASLLASLSADTPYRLKHLVINDIIKSKKLHDGYDERLKTLIVDEDKILDELEVILNDGDDDEEDDDDDEADNKNGLSDNNETGKKSGGGWILDWHVCDLYPERWVDLVVVLRCPDTGIFHDRLAGTQKDLNGAEVDGMVADGGRGYEGEKLQENIDAEIFGVIAEEAREGYPGEGRIVELDSVNAEDVDANCERILEWVQNWVKDRQNE